MSAIVTLFTQAPIHLTVEVTSPDERVPNARVLLTRADGQLIARRVAAEPEDDRVMKLGDEPRQLMYAGWEAEPGIQAQLFALVPAQGEEWKGDDAGFEALYLGSVVRAKECRVSPNSLAEEAADHFAAIMGGKTVEPIEQLMKRLA